MPAHALVWWVFALLISSLQPLLILCVIESETRRSDNRHLAPYSNHDTETITGVGTLVLSLGKVDQFPRHSALVAHRIKIAVK